MSQQSYKPDVRKELARLTGLSLQRLEENHLESIITVIDQWKKGAIEAGAALMEIRRLSEIKLPEWADGVNPGVPVAQALADKTLVRSDVSEETWAAIEHLVTIVEI